MGRSAEELIQTPIAPSTPQKRKVERAIGVSFKLRRCLKSLAVGIKTPDPPSPLKKGGL